MTLNLEARRTLEGVVLALLYPFLLMVCEINVANVQRIWLTVQSTELDLHYLILPTTFAIMNGQVPSKYGSTATHLCSGSNYPYNVYISPFSNLTLSNAFATNNFLQMNGSLTMPAGSVLFISGFQGDINITQNVYNSGISISCVTSKDLSP